MGYVYNGNKSTRSLPTIITPEMGQELGIKPCGTNAGYRRHRNSGEESCEPCLNALAAYEAARAGHGTSGRRLPKVAPCGSTPGAQAHRKRGEDVCFKCRLAEAEASARSRARRKAAKAKAEAKRLQKNAQQREKARAKKVAAELAKASETKDYDLAS